jgi:glycosyltransferase involved in cell wall biosynthesis
MNTAKVAHFLPHYPGREGTTVFCRNLVSSLNRIVPLSAVIISLRDDSRSDNLSNAVLRYPTKHRRGFRLPKSLFTDLDSNRHAIDGFVLHGTFNPPMARMGFYLRSRRIPYIFIPHDPYSPFLLNHHKVRKLFYWHLFEKPLIEGAVAIQLLDDSHSKFLRGLACSAKTFTIPNGCDIEALKSLTGKESTPGESSLIRIQYLGRLDRNHKGLDLLIDAFALYLKRRDTPKNVQLVLSGNDWTDRVWLENQAVQLGIKSKVYFTGERAEPSVCVHASADLAVLPSRFDGFGLTIVEAMLAARPVIVSSETGVASHVERAGGGWVCKPTAQTLSTTLATSIAEKSRWNQMGVLNQNYVINHLSWEHIAHLTMKEYNKYFG